MSKRLSTPLTMILGLLLMLSAVLTGGCSNEDSTVSGSESRAVARLKTMSFEQAMNENHALLRNVTWRNAHTTRRAKIQLSSRADLTASLPDIGKFPLVVNPARTATGVVAEIFSSTEKSGKGTDGWLVEVAKAFNASGTQVNGRTARVAIRKIASGTGYQFIASGKHLPHAFTPSNHLWVRMAEAGGITMTPLSERLVGNTGGIVMKEEVAARLAEVYPSIGVASLIDAVVQGRLVMGYTNPFASSTGLNFLVTVLSTFAQGDETRLLQPEVAGAFESFQRGVPYVALTTLQMRDSVTRGGQLDAFVMERQTFRKTPALRTGYRFVPFGVRHDTPLYAVGDVSAEVRQVLEAFVAFAVTEKYTALANEYGFNDDASYVSSVPLPQGSTLVRAQKLWKEKKDAGRTITAVFLADVSGSMSGSRLARVKVALRAGAEFVATKNSIGLVAFSDAVDVRLPIRPFDLNQKASFLAAVEDLDAGGGTAMYDGIMVALNELAKAKAASPDIKPILFVLTDGETTAGYRLNQVADTNRGLRIPVYTVGYEARIAELAQLSSIVEAASINADKDEVSYKIGNLLNAQM